MSDTVTWSDFAPAKVALCVIGTGKYRDFFPRLVHSARRYFLPEAHVSFVAFSDGGPIRHLAHAWVRVQSCPWPLPTLLRYRWMLAVEEILRRHDYVFYVDVDAEFVDIVDEAAVLHDLVAIQHTGSPPFSNRPWPHEDRPRSTAYVPPEERAFYCAGGFQGGRTSVYLEACRELAEKIDVDMDNKLYAVWHDESHWNRYLIKHPPTLLLPGSWGCDEIDRLPGARIVWLRKDHATIRQ